MTGDVFDELAINDVAQCLAYALDSACHTAGGAGRHTIVLRAMQCTTWIESARRSIRSIRGKLGAARAAELLLAVQSAAHSSLQAEVDELGALPEPRKRKRRTARRATVVELLTIPVER